MTTHSAIHHSTIDLSGATLADIQAIADHLVMLHGDSARVERAAGIVIRRQVQQVGYGAFRVQGSEDGQSYIVCRGLSCECQDRLRRGTFCKHLLSAEIITSLGDLLTRREREQQAETYRARLRVVAG